MLDFALNPFPGVPDGIQEELHFHEIVLIFFEYCLSQWGKLDVYSCTLVYIGRVVSRKTI